MENVTNSTGTPGTVSTRLFDQVIADPKNAAKGLNSKLTEKATKRKFQAAYDDCERQKDEAELAYNLALTDITGLNINILAGAKDDIDAADATQEQILSIYEDLFGEDMIVG